MRNPAIPALLLVLSVLPAKAQPSPAPPAEPPVPDWSSTVETVNVNARPGPAVWHVTRGESEVWILGTVGAMPKDLDWNKQYLSDLLDGARAIIVPPSASINLFDAGWFLLTHVGDLDMSLPRGQTLQPMIPEPVWTHFLAVTTAIGDKPNDYKTDMPLGAARRLMNRTKLHAKLIGSEPR